MTDKLLSSYLAATAYPPQTLMKPWRIPLEGQNEAQKIATGFEELKSHTPQEGSLAIKKDQEVNSSKQEIEETKTPNGTLEESKDSTV